MLTTHFKSSLTLEKYRSGPAGSYLDDFTTWLESRGYRRSTVRHHVRGAFHFSTWCTKESLTVNTFNRVALEKFRRHLGACNTLR